VEDRVFGDRALGSFVDFIMCALPRVRWAFTFAMADYNLIRLPKLLEAKVA
jgi:hypothetical protein